MSDPTKQSPQLEAALRYREHGLSVIPVKADGSKAPAVPTWKRFQTDRADETQLRQWFGNCAVRGLAIIAGEVSGNLLVIDFERAELFDQWRVLVAPLLAAAGIDPGALPVVETPRPGRHVYLLTAEPPPGNDKLAMDTDGKTLIETRGEGGYVLAPGSPAACHETGREYQFISYGWINGGEVPRLGLDLLDALLNCCRALARSPTTPSMMTTHEPHTYGAGDGERPRDVYNREGDWKSLLTAAGGTLVSESAGVQTWRRPGKDRGISATVGARRTSDGVPLLIVFSTNWPPFEATSRSAPRGYTPFHAYALLNHHGDFKAAAKALAGSAHRTHAGTTDSGSGSPQTDEGPQTGAQIILDHFRERYRPTFRTGSTICCEDGSDVPMGVACNLPDSLIIARLASATNAPTYRGGGVNHDALPGFFRKWVRVAWGDLIATLPDEDTAALADDAPTAQVFHQLVREAMLSEVVLGDVIGKAGVTQTERRSLIDWCARFAKLGAWKSIRSKKCWCKLREIAGGELLLMVAIRHEIFSQVKADRRLCDMGPKTFSRRAARYAVGSSSEEDRPQGERAIVLAHALVADLVSTLPDDEHDLPGDAIGNDPQNGPAKNLRVKIS